MNKLMSFLKDEDGQGAVEYGLIIALIAIIIVVALLALRKPIQNKINEAQKTIEDNK